MHDTLSKHTGEACAFRRKRDFFFNPHGLMWRPCGSTRTIGEARSATPSASVPNPITSRGCVKNNVSSGGKDGYETSEAREFQDDRLSRANQAAGRLTCTLYGGF